MTRLSVSKMFRMLQYLISEYSTTPSTSSGCCSDAWDRWRLSLEFYTKSFQIFFETKGVYFLVVKIVNIFLRFLKNENRTETLANKNFFPSMHFLFFVKMECFECVLNNF